MRVRMVSAAASLSLGIAAATVEQGPATPETSTAQIKAAPIELPWPNRYRVPVTLEPSRQVRLIAPGNDVLRRLTAPTG